MFKYVKHSLFHIMGLEGVIFITLGGNWITFGLFLSVFFLVIGDIVLGDDRSVPKYDYPKILTWQLWIALPLLCLLVFITLWQFASTDLFGFGMAIESNLGINVLDNRGNANATQTIACIFLTGFNIGMIGTITAHELVHRTSDKISMFVGRWLLAFSFDSNFSIEHVYGHHRYVSTSIDPATAPRGRNVYYHIIASTIKGNVSAWNIEKKRLNKKQLTTFSFHNRAIRGYLMSVCLLLIAYQLAGLSSLLILILAGLWGKCLLEIVNYMEHYGIVRNPKTPVQPRHSWNTNKCISSWAMFNLTRHSHHHAKASVPYHKLEPMADSPEMISGYLGTIIITLLPPLWYKLMAPKLLDWDTHYATKEELAMLHSPTCEEIKAN